MKYSLMALTLLALLPTALQAATVPSHSVASGTINFVGKIASPTCEISHDKDKLVSSCYRETSDKTFDYIKKPVNEMSSELVAPVSTEFINNDPSLKVVTMIYN
ncbi:hypothetical protein [Serratia grimesii]|uniref:hypothetical protein n=1 Tax=Serratia grimesii TaxID=82995 RepID=UPI0039AFC1F6